MLICNLVAYGDTASFLWNSTHRLGYECIILCRVWKARAAPIPTLNINVSTNISEMDIFSKRFRIYVKTSTMLLQIWNQMETSIALVRFISSIGRLLTNLKIVVMFPY